MKQIITFFILLLPALGLCQDKEPDETENNLHENINQSAEIAVDLISIFKNNNPTTNQLQQQKIECDFCVENKTDARVSLTVEGSSNNTKELVIPSQGKECLCNLNQGLVKYTFTDNLGVIIKKGEMVKKSEQITLVLE